MSGDVLLSHKLPLAVPSALKGLTSGFGMGPGVSLSLWPPKLYGVRSPPRCRPHQTPSDGGVVCRGWSDRNSGTTQWTRNIFEGQALGLLVPVGWALLLYTSGLSTQWSAGGLTRLPGGKPHLETCFPLRCFQRLSLPNVANQPCSWRNNWHTRGSSIPVLSY